MKKISIKVWTTLIVINICIFLGLSAFAHSDVLDVEYDECSPPTYTNGSIVFYQDGEDEMWYSIAALNTEDEENPENNIYCEYHLNDTITTIKYYFEDTAEFNSNYTWTTDIYRYYISQGTSHIKMCLWKRDRR